MAVKPFRLSVVVPITNASLKRISSILVIWSVPSGVKVAVAVRLSVTVVVAPGVIE